MLRVLLFLLSTVCLYVQGQVFYSENFSPGYGWALNTYNNLTTTTEGDSPNIWYVSDTESGRPVGNRGDAGCGNPTLHMGSTTIGDGGAAYDAGGCTNFGFGPCASCVANGLYCVTTDRAAISPVISTIGKTNITLDFKFIHFGTALLDNAQVIYSVNSGATWNLLGNLAKATCCALAAACSNPCTVSACNGSRQGQWAQYSSVLPIACENIAGFMVGLRWYNDDVSTSSADPSVAIDDLTLSIPIVVPLSITYFSANYLTGRVFVNWKAENEHLFENFVAQKSPDGVSFYDFAWVKSAYNPDYSVVDENPFDLITYYRIKEVDRVENYQYSNIIAVNTRHNLEVMSVSVIPDTKSVKVTLNCLVEERCAIEFFDLLGNKIINYAGLIEPGESDITLSFANFPKAVYVYKIASGNTIRTGRIVF